MRSLDFARDKCSFRSALKYYYFWAIGYSAILVVAGFRTITPL